MVHPDHPRFRRPGFGARAAQVWLVLSALGSVSTTVAMVMMERCNRAEVARLERRIETLEGSAGEVAHRLDSLQPQFVE